ncbi:S-adenosylmethionine mitochondrial carrier protein, partial [Schistosoma japonicum]
STAGLSVDLALFPIDTIKTRLQSHNNVRRTGSFRLFAGLPAVAIGSAPGAAAFFLTYEAVKDACKNLGIHPMVQSTVSACIAEVVACVIRVPCEVVKQRTQNQPSHSVSTVFLQTLRSEGIRGFYRGYVSTLSREIPFSVIQYPIWEKLRYITIEWNRKSIRSSDVTDLTLIQLKAWQSAMCGCLAGTIAGALTTPLDVAKTRIMLAEPNSNFASGHIIYAIRTIFQENGIRGLFSGLIPRISLLSIGGAIFLGIYDISARFWTKAL